MLAQRIRDTATYCTSNLSQSSPLFSSSCSIFDSGCSFSSPPHSALDPNLRPFAISTTGTLPTFFHTTSPTTSIDSTSPMSQTPNDSDASPYAVLVSSGIHGDYEHNTDSKHLLCAAVLQHAREPAAMDDHSRSTSPPMPPPPDGIFLLGVQLWSGPAVVSCLSASI